MWKRESTSYVETRCACLARSGGSGRPAGRVQGVVRSWEAKRNPLEGVSMPKRIEEHPLYQKGASKIKNLEKNYSSFWGKREGGKHLNQERFGGTGV